MSYPQTVFLLFLCWTLSAELFINSLRCRVEIEGFEFICGEDCIVQFIIFLNKSSVIQLHIKLTATKQMLCFYFEESLLKRKGFDEFFCQDGDLHARYPRLSEMVT